MILAGAVIVGLDVSSIINIALVVFVLPHSSVDVKITVVDPVLPHRSLSPLKLWLHVTDPHPSVATAPPRLFNHVNNWLVLPLPSHCTVSLEAGVPIVGGVVSCIITSAKQSAVFPAASVALNLYNLRSVLPHCATVLINRVLSTGTVVQLSVAVALVNHVVIDAALPAAAHSNTKFAGHVITGAVQSLTTTLKLQLAVCPLLAVIV